MREVEVLQEAIEALRRSAARELRLIKAVVGPADPLYLGCLEVWRLREGAAATSIEFGDLANAEVILDRGLHALRHALTASRRERIPAAELIALMAGC